MPLSYFAITFSHNVGGAPQKRSSCSLIIIVGWYVIYANSRQENFLPRMLLAQLIEKYLQYYHAGSMK